MSINLKDSPAVYGPLFALAKQNNLKEKILHHTM